MVHFVNVSKMLKCFCTHIDNDEHFSTVMSHIGDDFSNEKIESTQCEQLST